MPIDSKCMECGAEFSSTGPKHVHNPIGLAARKVKMKGRPPVIPRIEALEQQVQAQYQMIQALEKAVLELAESARDARKPYVQQFTQWPSNGRT